MKKTIYWDLGLRHQVKVWRSLWTTKDLKQDFIAGATVACIALPLSLAIALASGVSPAVGLVTAVVAGIVCAFMGGTPLSVTGPAAAMAVLIASVVQQFGVAGLLIVGLGCGILQLLTGILNLGTLISFVPMPVVAGFTAGIGAIIFIGQLPRALGLPPPEQSHVVDVILHIRDLILQTNGSALFLCVFTLALTFILPKISKKIPAPLVAVAIPSVFAFILKIPVKVIGEIPKSLPLPHLPDFTASSLVSLIGPIFMVYALASLETLLSSSAVDKLSKTKEKHDPNQEMIGQGFGNMITSLFGGIPVTGVIVRSALNVQAGGRTQRSAIFHALILMFSIYFLADFMEQIPISVLAGILLSVALRMLNVREFIDLWQSSRLEAGIYAITFATIVSVDLIAGVQAGIIAALVIVAIRFGRAKIFLQSSTSGVHQISFSGNLTFLSSTRLAQIQKDLKSLKSSDGVVFDMSAVTSVDLSGLASLQEMIEDLLGRDIKVALKAMAPPVREAIKSSEMGHRLSGLIAYSDADVAQILGVDASGSFPFERVIFGVERFRNEYQPSYMDLFEQLATHGQKPHTLFITCCDSRIHPNLMTSTAPGELFIVRNIGNYIPRFGVGSSFAEGAAIEYSVGVLGVSQIIVCGHSECGAMKTVVSGRFAEESFKSRFPTVEKWLKPMSVVANTLRRNQDADRAAELNVTMQLENLMSYPIVAEQVKAGKLILLGWFYDIRNAEITRWDPQSNMFVSLERSAA